MSKIEKKKNKIQEKILSLENELKLTLQKKSQRTAINIQSYQNKILELKKELNLLN